jgi:hypothetical protein
MTTPKPQAWIREYGRALVMRIETFTGGRWVVTGDDVAEVPSRLPYAVAAMQTRADKRAGTHAVGPWRRVCQRCNSPMALEERNRPDTGSSSTRDELWICSSRICRHAEAADD